MRTSTGRREGDGDADGPGPSQVRKSSGRSAGRRAGGRRTSTTSTSTSTSMLVVEVEQKRRRRRRRRRAECGVVPPVSLTVLADGTPRPMAGALPIFSAEEVALHNTAAACWLVANGNVYDVTTFLNDHPAGPQCILNRAGGDATRDFEFHLSKGKAVWRQYKIGVLDTKPRAGCLVM